MDFIFWKEKVFNKFASNVNTMDGIDFFMPRVAKIESTESEVILYAVFLLSMPSIDFIYWIYRKKLW